jgi:hypothetical protein
MTIVAMIVMAGMITIATIVGDLPIGAIANVCAGLASTSVARVIATVTAKNVVVVATNSFNRCRQTEFGEDCLG